MRNESRNRSSQQQQSSNNKREPNGGILHKFSGILRHVSNSSIANSVRTAGASILTSNDTDDRAREQVTGQIGESEKLIQPSFLVQARQFLIAMVVMDTWQYFVHRYMHHNKFLYRHIHSRHHRLVVPYAFGAPSTIILLSACF